MKAISAGRSADPCIAAPAPPAAATTVTAPPAASPATAAAAEEALAMNLPFFLGRLPLLAGFPVLPCRDRAFVALALEDGERVEALASLGAEADEENAPVTSSPCSSAATPAPLPVPAL